MRVYFTFFIFLIMINNYHSQDLKERKIYDYSSRLREKGFEKNGKKEGRWQFYDINEELSLEKDYQNGIENGEWLGYEHGKLLTKGTIANGKSTGIWTFYFYNGSISETGARIDGKKEGLWKRYHENGTLFLVGKYINDKEDGVWKSFYENGKTQSIWYYKDGKNIGLFQKLDPLGRQIEYGNYNLDGNETGKWRRAIDDYFEEGLYNNNGHKIGLWKITDSMGNLKETHLHIKDTNEIHTTYYPDGSIKETYSLLYFQNHGKYKQYYKNGILMESGRYYLGQNVRIWKFYNKDGKLDHKVKHKSIAEAIKFQKRDVGDVIYSSEKDSLKILRKRNF